MQKSASTSKSPLIAVRPPLSTAAYQRPPVIGADTCRLRGLDVHDLVAHSRERTRLKRLSEEVRIVIRGTNQRHVKLEGFYHISNEEVAPCYVLGPVM